MTPLDQTSVFPYKMGEVKVGEMTILHGAVTSSGTQAQRSPLPTITSRGSPSPRFFRASLTILVKHPW